MLIEILVTIFIGLLIIIYLYHKYVILNFRKMGVSYIKPYQVENYTAVIIGKITMGEFFRDAYLKYKNHNVFGMYAFFNSMLVVTDLELIRTILTKEFLSFHDRGLFIDEKIDPLTTNLLVLPGKKWKQLRAKMTPTFTPRKLKQMFSVINEIGENFARYLEKEAQMGATIEIKDLFARYTTDVIMSLTLGINSNCIENPDNEYHYWGQKIAEPSLFRMIFFLFVPKIPKLFSIPTTPKEITKFFMKMFQDTVEYRKIHNIVRHDFLNLLIQLMEKGYVAPDDDKNITDMSSIANEKLTVSEGAAQVFIFFTAGFETSATAATNCLYELAQHQDIQDKVRNEIDKICEKHNGLSYDAINEMTYLHKVINETLRKYPSVTYIQRICTKDIKFPATNTQVQKGTTIVIPVLGIHRDPSIYPDPDKFDPERFNAEEIGARHSYAFLPFGEGPRICIGAKLGYLQTKIGLVNVLSKYKFKLAPQTPVPLTFKTAVIVLKIKNDVHLIIESR